MVEANPLSREIPAYRLGAVKTCYGFHFPDVQPEAPDLPSLVVNYGSVVPSPGGEHSDVLARSLPASARRVQYRETGFVPAFRPADRSQVCAVRRDVRT